MGGVDAPRVPNATEDLNQTLYFMRHGGAQKAFKMAKQYNPKFQDLGWDRIGLGMSGVNDISQRMWDSAQGLTPQEMDALKANMMGGLSQSGLQDSDYGMSQLALGIGQADLAKRQQNFGSAMGTLGLSPGAAFGAPDVQQLFDAQRAYSQSRAQAEWQQRMQNQQRNQGIGAGSGALAGGTLGTFIAPGIGTLIGAGIGAGVGGAIGSTQY